MSELDPGRDQSHRVLQVIFALTLGASCGCLEFFLISSAVETGELAGWIAPIAIGLVGVILGSTAAYNMWHED